MAARCALARRETERVNHETLAHFSGNGTAPFSEEDQHMRQVGSRPRDPRSYKLDSSGFAGKPSDDDFDDTVKGSESAGSLFTEDVTVCLLDHLYGRRSGA